MKKLKINYLFIGILALLLAVALWPSIPWFGKADNRIAAIQARGELRVSTIHTPLTYNEINGNLLAWITNWRNSLPITSV
ncbi:putative lytic transglycosylase [Escherichia coli]|uniref:Putative lytic transglycosylase n=1 Tax=Escherichia coli TaxID=562 RepID=A0A376KQZ3_ECOLX|nr:putative lytic transglycosylase [Escherichia coli]